MPNKPLPGPYALDPFQSDVTELSWGAAPAGYVFTWSEQFLASPTRVFAPCTLQGNSPPGLWLTTLAVLTTGPEAGPEWPWPDRGQTVVITGRLSGASVTWNGSLATCDAVTTVYYPLVGAPGSVGQWHQAIRGGAAPYVVSQIRTWTDNQPGFTAGELLDGVIQ